MVRATMDWIIFLLAVSLSGLAMISIERMLPRQEVDLAPRSSRPPMCPQPSSR